MAGLTGNYFFERRALYNTKADKFIVARPWITVFDTKQVRDFFEAKNRVARGDGTFAEQYYFKHVIGGDQATNEGVLVSCKEADQFGRRIWEVAKELTRSI
jgi:hypothetical protein